MNTVPYGIVQYLENLWNEKIVSVVSTDTYVQFNITVSCKETAYESVVDWIRLEHMFGHIL